MGGTTENSRGVHFVHVLVFSWMDQGRRGEGMFAGLASN